MQIPSAEWRVGFENLSLENRVSPYNEELHDTLMHTRTHARTLFLSLSLSLSLSLPQYFWFISFFLFLTSINIRTAKWLVSWDSLIMFLYP